MPTFRARGLVIGAAVLALGLGGCARPAGRGGTALGTGDGNLEPGGAGASCLAKSHSEIFTSLPPTAPIPDGFVPVKATRCQFTIELRPGDGEWELRLEQSGTGDLAALVTELRQPSARQGGPLTAGDQTFDVGDFAGSATLQGPPAAAFIAAVNAAPPVTAPCSAPQAPFALVFPKGQLGRSQIMVELGGCHRMDDTQGNLRQLDASITLPG